MRSFPLVLLLSALSLAACSKPSDEAPPLTCEATVLAALDSPACVDEQQKAKEDIRKAMKPLPPYEGGKGTLREYRW